MSDLTPHQVAVADQWLASLNERIAHPLDVVRRLIADQTDPATAYVTVSRQLADLVDLVDTDSAFRANIAFSYIAALYLLAKQENP